MIATPDRAIVVALPSLLDFEDNYETTASHFRLLRRATQGHLRVKSLRFDQITYISPAAALVLASEVDRWNQRLWGRLRADVDSWNEDIKRLLCEMGYFELLGLKRPVLREQPKNVTFLRFIRGDAANPDSGRLARQLRVNIEAIVAREIKRHSLFEGLSEAITNVGQHAYPEPFVSNLKKQWWLSASYNQSSRELIVMFYDQGDGIPRTLPAKWRSFELVKDVFYSWTDSQKIEAAMQYGRSSTSRAERGKGLQNLVQFAKAYDGGRLSIYSNRGLYRMVPADASTTTLYNHETSVGGTLIEWSVRL